MVSVRKGCFETNSSSMHTLVVPRYDSPKLQGKSLSAEFRTFSWRRLVAHKDPESKFSYLWILFLSHIPFPSVKGPYTDKMKEDARLRLKRFRYLMGRISREFCEDHNGFVFDYADLTIDFDSYEGSCYWTSTDGEMGDLGCYGNASVAAEFGIDKVADDVKDIIDPSRGDNMEDIDSWEKYYKLSCVFRNMFDFAFSEKSILIQNTDETSDSDEKKHRDLIKRYMAKNNYESTVLWPLGG